MSNRNPHYSKVLKFGGSSVGSPESLAAAVRIICGEAERSHPVVVVSALSGVTDQLVELANLDSIEAEPACDELLQAIRERHVLMADRMLKPDSRASYLNNLDAHLAVLHRDVYGRKRNDRADRIVARGELMSAPLVAALLCDKGLDARAVDARQLVRTSDAPSVDEPETARLIRLWYADWPVNCVPVVTGFIARPTRDESLTSLLGRGGSDYTAALLAESIGASKLDRWTDVDGLHTADPRRYKGTRSFLYLLLEDASTWNQASTLGMHRHTFEPALRACFPVHVRSTKYPERDGTLIVPRELAGRIEHDARSVLARAEHVTVSENGASARRACG